MRLTSELAKTPLFQIRSASLPIPDRIKLSYDKSKAIVRTFKLTADDILNVSTKYWEFHTDPLIASDCSVATLLTIHYNLCAGTLAMFANDRADVTAILDKLLTFELNGQFCLTELGHGLDVINMETTATMQSNGDIILNTPVPHAAKFMPPTSPSGYPCIAIVFARLIIGGEDRGPKPFIVPLHNGKTMHAGITSKVLATRGGSHPVAHALTYFKNVRLPPTALLGSPEKAKIPRAEFFFNISRVISGTLSMGALGLATIRLSAYIAGQYSIRRKVIDASTGLPRPIISFSTQYIPVIAAIAQTHVMNAFANHSRELFVSSQNPQKHFFAAVFKATMMRFAQSVPLALGDRCGAQGLAEVNQLSVMHADMRGAAVAEGDILGISIRFAMDVLLGRVKPASVINTSHILAQREASMISEMKDIMASTKNHRNARVEAILLPLCQPLIEAIGHRMAYEAAEQSGVDHKLLQAFVASVFRLDPGWFIEKGGVTRAMQAEVEREVSVSLLPRLEELLDSLDCDEYVTAPMVSDERWALYVDSLKTYTSGSCSGSFIESHL